MSRVDFVKELVADLLAISLRGPSYLYALYLEAIGTGLASTFEISHGVYDLNMISNLEGVIATPEHTFRMGCLRLLVGVAWLRAITPDQNVTPLFQSLTNGIGQTVGALLEYVDAHSRADMQEPGTWADITADLIAVIDHFSDDADVFQPIRDWLARVDYPETPPAPLRAPLSPLTREFLMRGLWQRKMKYLKQSRESVQTIDDDISAHYSGVYGLIGGYSCSNCERNCHRNCIYRGLFSDLYDIPWQCSLLKGLDLVHLKSEMGLHHPQGGLSESIPDLIEQWFHKLYEWCPLGREFYTVALDLHLNQRESPHHYFQYAHNVVEDIVRRNNPDEVSGSIDAIRVNSGDYELLHDWLHPQARDTGMAEENNNTSMKSELSNRSKDIRGITKAEIEDYCTRFDAINLLGYHPQKPAGSNFNLLIERIQERKLQILLSILDDDFANQDSIAPLHNLLSTRNITSPDAKDKFVSPDLYRLLSAGNRNSCSLGYPDRLYLLGRYGFSSYRYEHKYLKMESMKEANSISNDEQEHPYVGLLGRYDGFFLNRSKPMERIKVRPHYSACSSSATNRTAFLPYFSRWEMAIPAWLSDTAKRDIALADSPVIALLSVTLAKNASRLSLLHRLYRVMSGKYGHLNGNPIHVEHLSKYLEPEIDNVFISDGWADLLLIIRGRDGDSQYNINRFNEIFNTQGCLYNDIQVERTELIFPRCCFYYALLSEHHKIQLSVRVRADRKITPENHYFQAQLLETMRTSFKNMALDDDKWSLHKTPGRLDYSIHIGTPSHKKPVEDLVAKYGESAVFERVLDGILTPIAALDVPNPIRRMQTNISLILPNN